MWGILRSIRKELEPVSKKGMGFFGLNFGN
jgi:hypothetical protein